MRRRLKVELNRKHLEERARAKRKAREQRKREEEKLGEDAPPKKAPRTLDNTREPDDTVVDAADVEVQRDIAADEFAAYFSGGAEPKIAITTSAGAGKRVRTLAMLLARIFAGAEAYARRRFTLEQICTYCRGRGYTDVLVLNENKGTLSDMLLTHLPQGPTAHFDVVETLLPAQIPDHGDFSRHPCELILNNFVTRLGVTVGRMLAALFPQAPDFHGRRVATFHCQRDFIFLRHHRYVFAEAETDRERQAAPVVTRIQELGPRMTLKLRSIRLGALDDTHGEFLFVRKRDITTSRRRFFL